MFVSQAFAQAAGSEVAANAAEHGKRVFPPFDFAFFASHLFWLIVCFGLFYLFISRIVLPRLGAAIETRRDRIASDVDQAARMKEEADAAIAAYEKELIEARRRANAIAHEANDVARNKTEAERRKVEAALEEKLAAAETRINDIRDQAMKSVGAIAEEAAAQIVEELIGSSVNKSVVSNAVKAVQD